MKSKVVLVLMISMLLLASCAVSRKAAPADSSYEAAAPAVAPLPPVAEAPASEDTSGYAKGGAGVGQAVERMVIKNASLSIVVEDPASAMDRIAEMASAMGGWVVSSNLYKTTTDAGVELPQGSTSIRVPAERLDEAMAQIKALVPDPALDVQNESVSGQDVTSEYTDLSSRRKNLELAEAQLQKILEEAKKTEDVLAVFNQLTQVRGEIEVITGQMKYYEESASFSAVNVDLVSKGSIEPITVAGWEPKGIARDAVQTLLDTLKVLVNILIYFVILVLPVLLVLYAVVRLFIWLFRKIFRRKAKQKVEPPTPAAK